MNVKRGRRRGVAMVEAMIALLVFALVVSALLELNRAILVANEVHEANEQRLMRADRFLEYVSLWSREDLELRMGQREQGAFVLEIARVTPVLFAVRLKSANQKELFRTVLYRPAAQIGR